MGTLQIGARLVRAFGEGKNLRTIVTETLYGKTFTKVLDSNGNAILERVKKIDRYEVGNRKVSTITKVSLTPRMPKMPLVKNVTDRVYDGGSRLLGRRVTQFIDDDGILVKRSVIKRSSAGRFIRKEFNCDGIAAIRQTNAEEGGWRALFHNNKGLPVPRDMQSSDFEDMSLASMRRWHVEHQPDLSYAHEAFRLGYLDKQDDVLGTINNLDAYL